MEDSIFTKIIRGEIPAHRVYEDDRIIAIMDIHPVQPGMVLVIPKRQVDEFLTLEEADYHALMDVARKVAQRIRQVFPARKRVALQIEGLDVPHVHVKLFPFDTADEYRALPSSEETGHTALAELAARLAF